MAGDGGILLEQPPTGRGKCNFHISPAPPARSPSSPFLTFPFLFQFLLLSAFSSCNNALRFWSFSAYIVFLANSHPHTHTHTHSRRLTLTLREARACAGFCALRSPFWLSLFLLLLTNKNLNTEKSFSKQSPPLPRPLSLALFWGTIFLSFSPALHARASLWGQSPFSLSLSLRLQSLAFIGPGTSSKVGH